MPFEEAYNESIGLAKKTLAGLDPKAISIRTGGCWEGDDQGTGALRIPFWGGECAVRFPEIEIRVISNPQALKPAEQIVILHYLIHAQGVEIQGEWVTFRQIPSGIFYYDPFVKRCIRPFVSFFGPHPDLLPQLDAGLSGLASPGLGDVSLVLRPLPYVPIGFVLWKGDEEFPSEGNILFDRTAPFFLPTEDLVVLAGLITYSLIGRGREILQRQKTSG